MLKLGVVTRRGVRHPRTLFGRRRHISFLLLRELAADPASDPEEYDRLAGHACMPNGVWKLTRHGRLRVLDAAVMDTLATRRVPESDLVVCDLAASTGATSVDFYRTLQSRYRPRFIASDLYRDLVAVRSRRGHSAVVFDGSGQAVQYVCGRFVLPGASEESVAYPINRALKTFLEGRLAPAARAALCGVTLKDLGPFETAEVGGYEIVKLPMLTKDTLATIAEHSGFTFQEWNILEPLPERADIVRAVNILTPEHFPDDARTRAICNCVEAIQPGGLLVIGSSPTPEADSIEASIYAVERDHLVRLASLNGGSEIDALIARSYRVTESGSDVREGIVRHAHRG